ncbi:MAG: DUF134 domain-containing protein [Bacteroidaceae bacterium]|nr:DUF134 domain-containing protein [Dysgonamonadaceae bacterium]
MSRPKQCRKIVSPPLMIGFKPYGVPRSMIEEVILQYDEYEVIRLLDYEGMLQEQAAEKMNISRPTLTRIYENARKTIAKAFVEGKMIVIEGGNVDFGGNWYRCRKCSKLIDGLENHTPCKNCTSYGKDELTLINEV